MAPAVPADAPTAAAVARRFRCRCRRHSSTTTTITSWAAAVAVLCLAVAVSVAPRGAEAIDVSFNPCILSPCGIHTCKFLGSNSYNCTCLPGYTNLSPTQCVDIDECAGRTRICGPGGDTCTNLNGTYSCTCKPGYKYNTATKYCDDINECNASPGICGDALKHNCTNTPGGYACSCKKGYADTVTNVLTGAHTCKDINECALGACASNGTYTCSNTEGAHYCNCKTGYQSGPPITNASLLLNDCLDVNECSLSPYTCRYPDGRPETKCINYSGSFTCNCTAGYKTVDEGSAVSKVCKDIDECSEWEDKVCLTGTPHWPIPKCNNTIGSYKCNCVKGYTEALVNGYKTCVDVDECALGACGNGSASCTNKPGSYECKCKAGYTFDGITCKDKNECMEKPGRCGTGGVCVNKNGTYSCACNATYVSVSTGRNGPTCTKDICGILKPCGLGKCKNVPYDKNTCKCKTYPPGYDGVKQDTEKYTAADKVQWCVDNTCATFGTNTTTHPCKWGKCFNVRSPLGYDTYDCECKESQNLVRKVVGVKPYCEQINIIGSGVGGGGVIVG
ncbi:hypothetical protein HYH02_010179 [Chlamydomonas schloesseri]|uniref:EGF-like domain-containing protein n=1 Tax=Chlamydomonas schloesseri TaxID=2026947 RepID=A0A835THS5_9CHLO|nr:hypothetical protein HYH02_010179 [Chlamydomonas schloesseri]|eukprot:KAG2440599.1 hypothetical protein HYH02_010179 [Chlamydomonas schloesseri]